jgi:hypothetical protein
MRAQKLWFWVLLIAQLLLIAVLLLIVYAIVIALAAMAAGIIAWPLFVAFGLILVVACAGFAVTRKNPSRGLRRFGFATHGTATGLCLVLIAIIGWSWFHALRRRFLVPDGFQGDLYVLHSGNGTPPEKSWWRTTYRVPGNGILVTTDPPLAGGQSFSDEYDYVEPGGRLRELPDVGPGTLQDTAENRSDRSRVYTYFPRSGSGGTVGGCSYEDDEITVGTKAFILSSRHQTDIDAYLAQHPEVCGKAK